MLSALQLRQLPLHQQAQYVWEYGKFIDSKVEGETTVNMYWLDKYYAEVICNSLSNQVQDIELKEAFHDN